MILWIRTNCSTIIPGSMEKAKDEKRKKEVSEDLMEDMGKIVTLETFVPRYLNQAITFTGDDMGRDKAMMIMLLYIIMVIMAFVFGITISNTIRKEAGVIGTLRASGYTRGTDSSLYDTSGAGYICGCTDRKYPWIYCIEGCMRRYVLWKL